MPLDFTCIADLRMGTGESPVWDERTGWLHFVDVPGKALHTLDREGAVGTRTFESEVCSLGLAASGRLVVALRNAVILFDPASGAREEVCRIAPDGDDTRLNDGKVGPDGAFWVSGMDVRRDKQPIAALWRVTRAGAERRLGGLTIGNGLAWTADGAVMYLADSRGGAERPPWIDRFDFDPRTGIMSKRKTFAEPTEWGRCDGGACDAEGCYWSAGVSGGRLNRFSQDGELLLSVELPVPAPTMPCFGGPDYRTLYLTTLRDGRPAELLERHPQSGGLFSAPAPVAGFPAWRFLDG